MSPDLEHRHCCKYIFYNVSFSTETIYLSCCLIPFFFRRDFATLFCLALQSTPDQSDQTGLNQFSTEIGNPVRANSNPYCDLNPRRHLQSFPATPRIAVRPVSVRSVASNERYLSLLFVSAETLPDQITFRSLRGTTPKVPTTDWTSGPARKEQPREAGSFRPAMSVYRPRPGICCVFISIVWLSLSGERRIAQSQLLGFSLSPPFDPGIPGQAYLVDYGDLPSRPWRRSRRDCFRRQFIRLANERTINLVLRTLPESRLPHSRSAVLTAGRAEPIPSRKEQSFQRP